MSAEHIQEEYEALLSVPGLPWEMLREASVLVTGGTGLVGSALIRTLLHANERRTLGLRVLAPVRSLQKGRRMLPASDALALMECTVEQLPEIPEKIDWLIHGAGPTAGAFFMEHPVETIRTAVCGTMKVLELARKKQVKGAVYLSSMEVYGENSTDVPLAEEDCSKLKSGMIRNCYPLSKLVCENLCMAYCREYGVPVKAVRLAQTFGAGVPSSDGRVFAQFARAAIQGTDIRLATDGVSAQCFLSTADAVGAILTVLLKGEDGAVYNAANPDTFCSIREMGELVAGRFAGGRIAVHVNTGDRRAAGQYPPAHRWRLSADKLMALGWHPTADLEDMYRQLLRSWTEEV